MNKDNSVTYADTGVVGLEGVDSFQTLINWVKKTMEGHPEVRAEVGLYATVIEIGPNLGLAMSTDGVGTKLLVAEMMNKYDTVGIDCIAMNVNDIICVGARPIAMLDYIAVQDAKHPLLGEVGKGLYEGAKEAAISIPAGEIAQLKEMVRGIEEGVGFDLVGCAVGTLPLDRVIAGEGIEEGDAVVGLASSGLHSNGYSLARRVLLGKYQVDSHLQELGEPGGSGETVGEAMLRPTRIYVKPALAMLDAGLDIKAFLHITGDGFRNLRRVRSEAGFILDNLPDPPAIFRLIQREGNISNAEMANTFNLGVGFCVVVPGDQAESIINISKNHGIPAQVIGKAIKDSKKEIKIPDMGVIGREDAFYAV
jgi:phosphoribosylformylglycinamidine cyclo-ligase